jgi:hypothetical protein
MEPDSLPTELILYPSQRLLGKIYLDWTPQPGACIDFEGQTYAVLERRHQYQLRASKYQLHKVALQVQSTQEPSEKTLVDNRWVMGDITCRYNARSEVVRCAVNPIGPCQGCRCYEPLAPYS